MRNKRKWRVGDVVVWNENEVLALKENCDLDFKAKYGNGPFIILDIKGKGKEQRLKVRRHEHGWDAPLNVDGFLVDSELVCPVWFASFYFVKVNS